jgi:histidinol-phosphatase (PHP family)
MSWTNYHSHSNFCDGKYKPAAYIAEAITQDFLAYGFSSHAPLPFDTPWSMKQRDISGYFMEIARLKKSHQDKIQIYYGLEVDFIPGTMGPRNTFIRDLGLDYIIGSVHFVDTYLNGRNWEIDGTPTAFMRGLRHIFNGDIRKAVTRYFELTRQMLTEECPDVLGHLDKIKIQNTAHPFFDEKEDWYQEEMMKMLQTIAQSGVILEVNTRGLYKNRASDLYPSKWVLAHAHELNIPVTINSDAHHPREIAGQFTYAANVLREVGYESVHILLDSKWQPCGFDTQGLQVCAYAEDAK